MALELQAATSEPPRHREFPTRFEEGCRAVPAHPKFWSAQTPFVCFSRHLCSNPYICFLASCCCSTGCCQIGPCTLSDRMHYTCASTAWLAPKKQQRIDHTCWQFPYSIGWWRNLLWACPPHRPRRPLWLSSASASVHQWGHIADRLALACDTALWKSCLYHTRVGILCKSFCPRRSRDYLPVASGKVFWHDVCENIETHSSLSLYVCMFDA